MGTFHFHNPDPDIIWLCGSCGLWLGNSRGPFSLQFNWNPKKVLSLSLYSLPSLYHSTELQKYTVFQTKKLFCANMACHSSSTKCGNLSSSWFNVQQMVLKLEIKCYSIQFNFTDICDPCNNWSLWEFCQGPYCLHMSWSGFSVQKKLSVFVFRHAPPELARGEPRPAHKIRWHSFCLFKICKW